MRPSLFCGTDITLAAYSRGDSAATPFLHRTRRWPCGPFIIAFQSLSRQKLPGNNTDLERSPPRGRRFTRLALEHRHRPRPAAEPCRPRGGEGRNFAGRESRSESSAHPRGLCFGRRSGQETLRRVLVLTRLMSTMETPEEITVVRRVPTRMANPEESTTWIEA